MLEVWRRPFSSLSFSLLLLLLLFTSHLIPQSSAQLTERQTKKAKANARKTAQTTTTEVLSYRPINVTCPSQPLLRSAGTVAGHDQTINPDEAAYVEKRRLTEVADAFKAYLANDITGYDLDVLAPNASYCEYILSCL